jgi:hypothetical protein
MALSSVGYTPGSMFARFRQRPTAFQYAEAQRQINARHSQKFREQGAELSSAFSSAFSNQIEGMATITGQIALDRLNAVNTALRSGVNKTA